MASAKRDNKKTPAAFGVRVAGRSVGCTVNPRNTCYCIINNIIIIVVWLSVCGKRRGGFDARGSA